jgi:Ca2+-binding EF-hand superfamily protein
MNSLSSDDLIVLDSVFKKYDKLNRGYLDLDQFILFLVKLGKHVKELKKIKENTAIAVFSFIDKNSDGKINYEEFCNWWGLSNSSERYSYFTGEKSELLKKSYELYCKYSTTSSFEKNGIAIMQFEKMMDEFKIDYNEEEDFDKLDKDEDGLLSFQEFCLWLNWF